MHLTRSLIFAPVQLRILPIAICAWGLLSTARAQTQTILHNFIVKTGYYSSSGVIADEIGNLYGTTSDGGSANGGTIFKLDSSGHYTVLHNFAAVNPDDGFLPTSGLVRDAGGNLYGTTRYGGNNDCGTVYKMDPSGSETVLYSFLCEIDGAPLAGVILDPVGTLYGTTSSGGTQDAGTVFKLDPSGTRTVLHNFDPAVEGAIYQVGVIRDPQGNLYGATQASRNAAAVVYKLDPSGQLTILHRFPAGEGGSDIVANLVWSAAGNLYGVAEIGGSGNDGVVFKLDPSGSEIVLHSFGGSPSDGSEPVAPLTTDSFGNLYGTTLLGGMFNAGVIFKIDAVTHQESIIYNFDGTNGWHPLGLLLIVNGNIYGTTEFGGAADKGVIFKVAPAQ